MCEENKQCKVDSLSIENKAECYFPCGACE